MPRALVTGATGLLGSHIVGRLRADGWEARALVRDPARAAWLATVGAELAIGDVLDDAGFRRAAIGTDVIFHAAAQVTPGGESWEQYRETNVRGTRHAIEAAVSSGARLLHVSSVAVYGGAARYGARPTDEETPLAPLGAHQFYARSKRESEQMVLDAHRAGRVWATAVRPSVLYGPRDRQFVPRVGRLFTRLGAPLIAGGRSTLAIVQAANVADGAVRAAGCDRAGGRAYNLANDFDVTVAEFARLAGLGLGRHVRTVALPLVVATAGVTVMQWAIRLTRGRALAEQAGGTLGFLSRNNPFTSERARHELGWAPMVTPKEGVPDAFRWWKTHPG